MPGGFPVALAQSRSIMLKLTPQTNYRT